MSEDPWGRDPGDVNDEDLNDLYNKNKDRPPSVHSADKWGENEDEGEENPKPEVISKPSSRPSSQAKDTQAEDPFTHNRTPTPTDQSKKSFSKPSTPDNSEYSKNRKSDSKPGTPDLSEFRENRKPDSKPGTPTSETRKSPVPVSSRPSSKPNSPVPTSRPSSKPNSPVPTSRPSSKPNSPVPTSRPSSKPNSPIPQPSQPPSRRSSPIARSSRPQSLTNDRRSVEPGQLPTLVKEGSRPNSQISLSSRPSSKTEQQQSVNQSNNDGQLLRSDSKTIRDENLPLPKAVHKDEIRRRAFDNMKNKKAHPSYLFTKFPRVVEALMRFLPFRSLCKSQSVCRDWYRAGNSEKQRRNFIDSDCYKLELTKDDVEDDQDDDLQIDLHKVMDEMFVQPTTILAFMTWRTVTALPDVLFRILPVNCSSTCIASEAGVVGAKKNGKIRIYSDNVHESCSVLLIPKMEKFQIYQFSAYRPDQLKFDEGLFDSLGVRKYEDKKQIKCLLLFCSGGKIRNSNEISVGQLEKWEREFQNSFQCRAAIVGACVNFSQHGVKKILGKNSKLYSTENDVNGVAFQGENLEVFSLVFDKMNDEYSTNERMEQMNVFLGRSPSNSFAIILNSFRDGEEKDILKKFKNLLPNTRIAGLRTDGALFGQNFNSHDDRTSQKRQSIYLGQCLILILFKIVKNVKLSKSKNSGSGTSSRSSSNDKNMLKGFKVK